MILNIDGLRLEAQFLRPSLAIDDSFVIDKSSPLDVQPRLAITRGTNGPLVSWPTSVPPFDLVRAAKLPAATWEPFPAPFRTAGRRNIVELHPTNPQYFFRLHARP